MEGERTTITRAWVRSNLLEAVHLSGTQTLDALRGIPPLRELQRKIGALTLPIAEDLRLPSDGPAHERILAIMCARAVRRGPRTLIAPFLLAIAEHIEGIVNHGQPVSFVLPTLPFKDQSPFTAGAAIDHVDLGEHAMFAQLQRILRAIRTVYPPGAHLTLLCDGYIYADIFTNGDREGAGRYKARCEEIKNAYGLYNEVTLFDMREVLFDLPEWAAVEQSVREIIYDLDRDDGEVRERLDTLARRFVFHVAIPGLTYEEARIAYAQPQWPSEVWERLRDAAIRYSALQLTLQHTHLVERAFPSAIRCTVHPKLAPQLPLHLTNVESALLPYNGVATVSRAALARGQSLFRALRVRRLCDVLRHHDVVALHADGASDPFLYEIP